MSVTVKVNGDDNSLVHKGSTHIAENTPPDVCKTPSPGGPVPVPYPKIVSTSGDLANGTTTVKADGGNSCAIKGSEFSKCNGDEPGTAGGVVSSTNLKEATWILYSFDVKLDGKNACRLTDKMKMNHGNTVCMSGVKGLSVRVEELKAKLCEDFCAALADGCNRSSDLERKLADSGEYGDKVQFTKRVPFGGRTTIPDVVLLGSKGKILQCFDFKFPGDRWRGNQFWRQTMLSKAKPKRRPVEISCKACKTRKCAKGCKR